MITRRGNIWRIAVRDCGPGVPEAELERVCQPFLRIGEARDRDSGGYGLGLAIARRAMTLHDGQIRAANMASGGLEVLLELPVRRADATARAR